MTAETAEDDVTYQCFGTCTELSGSGNNTACGGDPSTKFTSDIFNTDTNCTAQDEEN